MRRRDNLAMLGKATGFAKVASHSALSTTYNIQHTPPRCSLPPRAQGRRPLWPVTVTFTGPLQHAVARHNIRWSATTCRGPLQHAVARHNIQWPRPPTADR
jgi:hypothetical protein